MSCSNADISPSSSPHPDGGRSALGHLLRLTEYVKCVHIFFHNVVANDCFRRLLYIFGYFRAFSCMPTFACFSQTISTATTAGPRRSLKFHPLLHHQRACNSQSRLLPHHLSWVLKPSMFLAYLSGLLPDVAPWEGPSDDTDPRLRFGVCSPGAGLGGVDGGLVEVLIVWHPRRISWTMFGRIRNEEALNVELQGPGT